MSYLKRLGRWVGGGMIAGLLWLAGYRRDKDDDQGPFG